LIAKIKEIFSSIQGEGLFVGEKQLFIRFTGCNLTCKYCDTDFLSEPLCEYSPKSLAYEISKYGDNVLSLTGGEPLLHADFLKEFLPLVDKKIYLETNGTLPFELNKIKDYVDVVAMDIKLESASGNKNKFDINEEFLKILPSKTFIKIVFDEKITEDEINNVVKIANNVPIILQPVMPLSQNLDFEEVFNRFYSKNANVRLIPQTHKFLNVR